MVTTSICQYRNHRGEILALAKGFVHHSPSDEASKSQGKLPGVYQTLQITPMKRSPKIEADKKKEEMRGSQPRFLGRYQRRRFPRSHRGRFHGRS